jgi:hypothetical protein
VGVVIKMLPKYYAKIKMDQTPKTAPLIRIVPENFYILSETDLEQIINSIKSKPRDVVALGKKFLYQQVEMDLATAYR